MPPTRIFTFWEPRGSMPAYLRLCMRTWARLGPNYDVVVIDYGNIDQYVPPGTYDERRFKRLTLGLQKDAILVPVLQAHGGIFMDVDTIVIHDLADFLAPLERAEVVRFNQYMGVVAARPHSRLFTGCLDIVRRRLAEWGPDDPMPAWDFTGSGAVEAMMAQMIDDSPAGRAYQAVARVVATSPRPLRALWDRSAARLWARRRGLFFRTVYRPFLATLDRNAYGFIPEALGVADYTTASASMRYVNYWFGDDRTDVAFRARQSMIALHHSWTPAWYTALTEEQVLEHPCRLSRTLRALVTDDNRTGARG